MYGAEQEEEEQDEVISQILINDRDFSAVVP